MITIERTFDAAFVEQVCKHPKIWKSIADDSANIDNWKPHMGEEMHWLTPVIDGKRAGVFLVYPITSACWEVHTAILPEFWGDQCLESARALIDYVFHNTTCSKLVTNVPIRNRLARSLAERAGMRVEYINKRSILKGGELTDQVNLAVYKGGICPQQQ